MRGKGGKGEWLTTTAGVALLALGGASSARAETAAGTSIVNVAQARYAADGVERTTASPASTIVVAERLDLTLTRIGDGPAAPGDTVAARLTNTGNGTEAYRLSTDGGDAIAIDRDGDGRFDAASDTALGGDPTDAIAPGATLTVLVRVPADSGLQVVTVRADAATGSGTRGSAYPGRGDGGGDAIDGATGARAGLAIPLTGTAMPTLIKRQSVRAPDGSAQPIAGAVITYTLDARFPSAVGGARIDDPIPAGTDYLAGSLSLDGATLSDAADADAGDAGPSAIAVRLGTVAAAARHTVQFKVAIRQGAMP